MQLQIEKHHRRQDRRPNPHSDDGNFENQVGIHAAPSGDTQRYSGDFNPGDFSHSLMCEPISACLALQGFIAYRSVWEQFGFFAKVACFFSKASSREVVCLKRRCSAITDTLVDCPSNVP